MNNKLQTIVELFEGNEIRSVWDSEKEEYYFSVVDVINALANPKDARKYWSVLKLRLKKECSEVATNCSQLKMLAPDRKIRLRYAMKTNDILRLIESIPSSKAEPFKIWLANLASEYKSFKGLRKENLRDNMSDIEVALTDLGEIATRELASAYKPYGFTQNKKIAKMGEHAAKVARADIEKNLGKSVIMSDNNLNYKYKDEKLIEESEVEK